MKKFKNLKGVKTLSKGEQKSINGGRYETCVRPSSCIPGTPQIPCPNGLVICMIYSD